MIHRMLSLSLSPLIFRETNNIYDTEHWCHKGKKKSNFDFVCRIANLSLNNSPNCNMNWSFLLDILGYAFVI